MECRTSSWMFGSCRSLFAKLHLYLPRYRLPPSTAFAPRPAGEPARRAASSWSSYTIQSYMRFQAASEIKVFSYGTLAIPLAWSFRAKTNTLLALAGCNSRARTLSPELTRELPKAKASKKWTAGFVGQIGESSLPPPLPDSGGAETANGRPKCRNCRPKACSTKACK